MSRELWKTTIGFKRYEVSNLGRVRSKGRWADHPRSKTGKRWWPEKLMKLTPMTGKNVDGKSYVYVGLYKTSGKQCVRLVHQLVLEAFVEKRPSRLHVGMHKDDNPENNRLSNLKWGTYKQNTADMFKKGRNNKVFPTGERTSSAKLTDKTARRAAKLLIKGWKVKDVATELSVSSTTISHVKSGRYWSHATGIKPS